MQSRKRPNALHLPLAHMNGRLMFKYCNSIDGNVNVSCVFHSMNVHSAFERQSAWISVLVRYVLNAECWTCHFMSIKYHNHCWWFLFRIRLLFTIQHSATAKIFPTILPLPARMSALSQLTAHTIVWIVIFIEVSVFCIPSNHLCFDSRVMHFMTLSTKNETTQHTAHTKGNRILFVKLLEAKFVFLINWSEFHFNDSKQMKNQLYPFAFRPGIIHVL